MSTLHSSSRLSNSVSNGESIFCSSAYQLVNGGVSFHGTIAVALSIFESDFIQITKRGEVIDVHNRVRMVTVGIACTSPILPLPDVMLLARPAPCEDVSGRGLLRPPVDSNSSTYAIPAGDMMSMPLLDEEHKITQKADTQGKKEPDQVSVKSLTVATEMSEISSSAFAGGEGIHHDSHIATVVSRVPTPKMNSKVLSRESVTGAIVGDLVGTFSLPANRSIGSGHKNKPTAGETVMGARGSKSYLTITSAGKMSPKSMKMALSGVASKSLEYIPNSSSSLSRKEIMTITNSRIETTGKPAGETANEPVPVILSLTVPSESHSSEDSSHRKAYTAKVRKERRTRRDQRAKERVSSRGEHHHRTGESRKTAGDKEFRKSVGHRGGSNDKKDKGSKRSRSHKGVSHIPITKESRSSHKLGRTLSTASSVSTNKRMGRISLFLRNIRANLAAKGLAPQRGQDIDIISKTLEKTDVNAVMETEDGQGLEIIDSVTSEVMETVTFEAH